MPRVHLHFKFIPSGGCFYIASCGTRGCLQWRRSWCLVRILFIMLTHWVLVVNGSRVPFSQRIALIQTRSSLLGDVTSPLPPGGRHGQWLSDRNIQRPSPLAPLGDRVCVPALPMGGTSLKPSPSETTSLLSSFTWPSSCSDSPSPAGTSHNKPRSQEPLCQALLYGFLPRTKPLLFSPVVATWTVWKWMICGVCIECIRKLKILGNEI